MALYAEERQLALARLTHERGRLAVTEVARRFEVTPETVRRDLSVLEQQGLIRRVHGGAVPADALAVIETGLVERDQTHPDRKQAIARASIEQLPPDGGTVMIDAGTTTAALARVLPTDRSFLVFTHSVTVAAHLATHPRVELHLLPGRVRPTTQAAVGAETVAAMAELRTDVCFIGTNGLTPGYGLSTPDPEEAAAKQAMIRSSRRTVCLADSSKLGVDSTRRFAPLNEVDVLVTDAEAGATDLRQLRRTGLEVVIA